MLQIGSSSINSTCTVSATLSVGGGGATFGPKLQKNECLGGLKEFLPQIFVWGGGGGGLTMFLVKKDCKIKCRFEDSITNADLGLF